MLAGRWKRNVVVKATVHVKRILENLSLKVDRKVEHHKEAEGQIQWSINQSEMFEKAVSNSKSTRAKSQNTWS